MKRKMLVLGALVVSMVGCGDKDPVAADTEQTRVASTVVGSGETVEADPDMVTYSFSYSQTALSLQSAAVLSVSVYLEGQEIASEVADNGKKVVVKLSEQDVDKSPIGIARLNDEPLAALVLRLASNGDVVDQNFATGVDAAAAILARCELDSSDAEDKHKVAALSYAVLDAISKRIPEDADPAGVSAAACTAVQRTAEKTNDASTSISTDDILAVRQSFSSQLALQQTVDVAVKMGEVMDSVSATSEVQKSNASAALGLFIAESAKVSGAYGTASAAFASDAGITNKLVAIATNVYAYSDTDANELSGAITSSTTSTDSTSSSTSSSPSSTGSSQSIGLR